MVERINQTTYPELRQVIRDFDLANKFMHGLAFKWAYGCVLSRLRNMDFDSIL
jgi:hypothetical protein